MAPEDRLDGEKRYVCLGLYMRKAGLIAWTKEGRDHGVTRGPRIPPISWSQGG
jgi:hypothetical protein